MKFESKLKEELADKKIKGSLSEYFRTSLVGFACKANVGINDKYLTVKSPVEINDDFLEVVNSKFLDYEGEFHKPNSMSIDKIH